MTERPRRSRLVLAFALAVGTGTLSLAPAAAAAGLDGARLGVGWTLPFVGLLLSIALLPLVAPQVWHRLGEMVLGFWTIAAIVPLALTQGLGVTIAELVHVAILDYVPFVILLSGLFAVTGGIAVTGHVRGTPAINCLVLAIGTLLAGLIGTTGASMLMVRVLIAANRDRARQAHIFVFFIFLVANIGGALSPLGDPPLFLGFLRGVSFFWPTINLAAPTLVAATVLLSAFLVIDLLLFRREPARPPLAHITPIRVHGALNVGLLVVIILAVMMSGTLDLGVVRIFDGLEIKRQSLLRDAIICIAAAASMRLSPSNIRSHNHFTWAPMREVAIVFAAIFVTIIPPLAMLKAGDKGAFAELLKTLSNDGQPANEMYFLLTGLLSSFLDNAPTYLVFFNAAGGDPVALSGPLASTLIAISAGAVFMGANTYIGNAPNFMVRSMVEAQGIRMPSFFGYMIWAAVFLGPVHLLIAVLFF